MESAAAARVAWPIRIITARMVPPIPGRFQTLTLETLAAAPAANLREHPGARTRRSDPRQIGTEMAAAPVDHVAAAAVRPEDPFAARGVAGLRRGRHGAKRAHVGEHLPDLLVEHALRIGAD